MNGTNTLDKLNQFLIVPMSQESHGSHESHESLAGTGCLFLVIHSQSIFIYYLHHDFKIKYCSQKWILRY